MMAQREQKQRDLASLMYPSLSRAAKVEQARQARTQPEQRERSRRTAENLRATIDAIRREREDQV